MHSINKIITFVTIAGLAITSLPSISAKALPANVEKARISSTQTSLNLPEGFKKNGWGENLEVNSNSDKTQGNTGKLQNAKLQGGVPTATCNANYFGTVSTPTTRYLTTDGLGNTYTVGYSNSPVYRINSSGAISGTIPLSSNLLAGDLIGTANGDVYQLTFDTATLDTKVYKIPNGTTQFNLIYTLTTEKYTSPESLKIDSSGNLHASYNLLDNNFNPVETKIEKITNTGTLLSTITLPNITSFGLSHEYNLGNITVSESGLIYIPIVPYITSSFTPYSILVLNSDGTQKGTFEYSSSSLETPNTFNSIAKLPDGITGGGVYASYTNSEGTLQVKRIRDTDILPIATTPDFSSTDISFATFINQSFINNDNTYLYFYSPAYSLKRLNIATSVMEDALPLAFGIEAGVNSTNQVVFALANGSDLFKLDCSTTYSSTNLTVDNIDLSNSYCEYNTNISGTSELGNECYLLMSKGLTFNEPTQFSANIVGSGLTASACELTNSINGDYLYCNVQNQMGSITTSSSHDMQIYVNNTGPLTIDSITTWQPFNTWSPNSITLAGKTEEILYNSKMYQAAFGTDSGLYLRSMDTSNVFSNWQRLSSITAKGTPTLSVDPNGDLYVFAHGTDNGLYYWKVGEVGGERWRRIGSITIKDAVTLHSFNGKYWLYATGTDNGLYVSKYTSFSATSYALPNWTKAGDITVNQTVQGAALNSKLYQIAIGTDFGLYFRSQGIDEVWGSWGRFDVYTYDQLSKPVIDGSELAISSSDKILSYAFVNTEFINGGFFQYSLNSESSTNVSLFNGIFTEVGYGVDGRLYYRNADQTNKLNSFRWMQGNGITIKDIPTQFTFNNRQYQFARGTDDKLWTRSRS